MIEKVNPMHPDKIADRIAGALVDLAYKQEKDPKIAVEVLIGHGVCHIIAESSVYINSIDVLSAVIRITGDYNIKLDYVCVPQDVLLSLNQNDSIKCGDNGIFKGIPLTDNDKEISKIARNIYGIVPEDGKYILSDDKLIICQSNIDSEQLYAMYEGSRDIVIVNPLGDWIGGTNVDTGATNRKLGSDMAQSITGGGLHGKDLSKADVSINIYAFLKAQEIGKPVSIYCAIGDEYLGINVDGEEIEVIPYTEIVETARQYINNLGGFEKFAEWGLY